MKINQLYIVEDYITTYQIHHFISDELIEIKIKLGDVRRIFSIDKFRPMPGKM